jgi:hypothetical protein
MAQGISRRKYGGITKYLTAVMQDKRESQRSRFAAAQRLTDIYMAADTRAAKLEDRKWRAELRALGQVVPEPVETPEPEPDHVQTVLDSVLASKKALKTDELTA